MKSVANVIKYNLPEFDFDFWIFTIPVPLSSGESLKDNQNGTLYNSQSVRYWFKIFMVKC